MDTEKPAMALTQESRPTRELGVRATGKYKVETQCRLCHSPELAVVIDFGDMPLANGYTRTPEEPEDLYPLTLVRCRGCGHMQIRETVDPEILFSNFLYATGDSPTLVGHFARYADEIVGLMGGNNFRVLEIASNDGVLAKAFGNLGVTDIVGVEPAGNLVRIAEQTAPGVYYQRFFNRDVAREIVGRHGTFDVVTANNVMAHVAEIESIMEGVVEALAPGGMFVFENAYLLDTIRNHCYDNTYHEHLQYFGIRPLVGFLERFGLEIFDIRHQETQAGSFRLFSKRKGDPRHPEQESVGRFLDEEARFGLYEDGTFERFRSDFHDLYGKLGTIVRSVLDEGKTLSCYGCSAKFALLSKTLGLNSLNTRYVVDDAVMKQGLLSPGGKIPIVGRERFVSEPTDYCIISAWNLADAIVAKNPQYPGKFIQPVPLPRVLPGNS